MTVVFDPSQPRQIERIVTLLSKSDAVALPTETVYGLAGIATNEISLAKIFALKARPTFDPLIVHVLDASWLKELTTEVSEIARVLIENFWPGPLTILLPKSSRIPDLCTANSPLAAFRSPSHPIFRRVLEELGEPLAAPSANRFGRISPTCSFDVVQELGPWGLSAVAEGGQCAFGVESTVVKILSQSHIEIVRPGAISEEALQEVLKKSKSSISISRNTSGKGYESPGQLDSHYAPERSTLYLQKAATFQLNPRVIPHKSVLLVILEDDLRDDALVKKYDWAQTVVLSKRNDSIEAAAKLFSTLRRIDADPAVESIVAIETSDAQLGLAINDRLWRASKK